MMYHILDDFGRDVLVQELEIDGQLFVKITATYGIWATMTFPVSQKQMDGYRKKKLSSNFNNMSVKATITQSR